MVGATPSDVAAPGPRRAAIAATAIGVASAAVVLGALLSGFRVSLGEDPALSLRANGARVLLGAGVGAVLALAGSLRQLTRGERPLRGLTLLAFSTGAAGGGLLVVRAAPPGLAWLAFAAGAGLGAGALCLGVRAIERPARWTNLAAAAALVAMIAVAALAGTYGRALTDPLPSVVAWLLGDLSRASFPGGAALAAFAIAVTLLAAQRLRQSGVSATGLPILALLGFAVGTGAAGPLAFVGSMVPRAVRGLTGAASPAGLASTSAIAGAATVVAIDAVQRLLVGGYAFPFNVAAGMLAIPVFLVWNRARLRSVAGPAHPLFEWLEGIGIAVLVLAAAGLVVFFTGVIRAAT